VNGLSLGIFGNGDTASPATLEDAGAMTEDGSFYLAGQLQIDTGATYTLTAPVSITEDGGSIVNNGVFTDADSSDGTSSVVDGFTNNGTLTVDAGDTLVLYGGTLGGTVDGAGTLAFGGGDETLTTTSLNMASISLVSAAQLTLDNNLTYEGTLLNAGTGGPRSTSTTIL
jgi:hypothetical protein